jgi:WhiB family redox-sensing transcriptional regulator
MVPLADPFSDWRNNAPCGHVDPEMFFDRAAASPDIAAEAKAICGGCPSREMCLDAAMISEEGFGIWGGMTPDERSSYRPMWQRMNGGKKGVRLMMQNNGIATLDPSIEKRYAARLEAATECRHLLLNSNIRHRRHEFLSVLELIISHPIEDSRRLARRLGISYAWFNTVKREAYSLFGVKEIYNKEDGVA